MDHGIHDVFTISGFSSCGRLVKILASYFKFLWKFLNVLRCFFSP